MLDNQRLEFIINSEDYIVYISELLEGITKFELVECRKNCSFFKSTSRGGSSLCKKYFTDRRYWMEILDA